MDLGLASERGGDRVDGCAVRDIAAVATSLADVLVDHDPGRRRLDRAPLAAPAKLGGAALVVDEDRDAGNVPQLTLHCVEFVAMFDAAVRSEALVLVVLVGVVGDHDDALDALGLERTGEVGHGLGAGRVLTTGHGDGAVVEDLEGDVGAGRDRLANGQRTRVCVRAVAEVLEAMVFVDERGHADPLHALAAHVGDAEVLAAHTEGHAVAADTAARHGSIG